MLICGEAGTRRGCLVPLRAEPPDRGCNGIVGHPRFGGGYPFSHTAGADYPAAILAWLDGEPFDTAGFARRYDAVFAKADGLVATSGVPLRRLDEHG